MNKFKFNDDNLNEINEKHPLNKNNIPIMPQNTYQNIYQNPLKIKYRTLNNSKKINLSFKKNKEDESKNNLNITPIEPEIIRLNNTFPNQHHLEPNTYSNISDTNIKDEIIQEYKSNSEDNVDQLNDLAFNVRENENKINQITKTMNLIINQKNDEDLIDSKSLFSQVNDIEKLQQENITLKADSIIYREDISSLVQSNDKYSQDLEIARKKIMELIDKNNEIEKEINHKNYQIEKLKEILARLRLYENQDVEYKVINNKSKDEVLYEVEYNVKLAKEENKKLIQDKKILEEKIQNLIENRDEINRNKVINNERENKMINELEEKIKILEKGIISLNDENNILNINNTKMEKELENLYIDKNNLDTKYNKKKEEFDVLQYNYNNLYNKYQHMLIESNKQLIKREKMKRNKSEKTIKNNKNAINELYNKIQILKTKVKNERNIEN